jgi:GT2 family glycosyltransferase
MPNSIQELVTVISVTYNSQKILDAVAKNLEKFANVIIVDNASRDGTTELLMTKFSAAARIYNPVNSGFGVANNIGMNKVLTEYALLLNPDTEIQLNDVEVLVNALQKYPNAAIVAPQGWRDSNTPQIAFRQAFYENRPKSVYVPPDAICSSRWLHGCCLLVRTEFFRAIGGFDEKFFLYYEDDDLCLRAIQNGYDCMVEPKAKVTHFGGLSSNPSLKIEYLKSFHFFRSRKRIIGKYIGRRSALVYQSKIMLAAPFALIIYAITFQLRHLVKWWGWGRSAWEAGFKTPDAA